MGLLPSRGHGASGTPDGPVRSVPRPVRLILVTPGAVTKRVVRLVERSLVSTGAHETDGRGQVVRLTRRGVRFVDRMIEVHLANEARLVGTLSDRERDQLTRLLTKLATSLR